MFNQFEKEQHLHGAGAAFQLSEKIKRVFNKRYCVLLNSATSAFEVIVIALNLKNKKVLTSCFNWPGALSPFIQHNNSIYFSKVNENLSIEFSTRPTHKPDIVLAVDYLGIAHNSQFEIGKWAKQRDMLYITDASCSMGSISLDGAPTGFFGDIIVTSFGPQKSFYGGEGGAILTDDELMFEKFISVSEHPYRHISEGFNANFYAFNFRMNPFGIEHLNNNFEIYHNNLRNRQSQGYAIYEYLKGEGLLQSDSPSYTSNNSSFSSLYIKEKKSNSIDSSFCFKATTIKPIQDYFLPFYLNQSNNSVDNQKIIEPKLFKMDL